jgi:hypothetical protein
MPEPTQLELAPKPEQALQNTTPMQLLQMALQKDAAIDVIERLTALQERAMDRNAQAEYTQAMIEVQQILHPIYKNKSAPNGKFADYEQIDRSIRPVYTAHGFALCFSSPATDKPDWVECCCTVSHSAGYSKDYSYGLPTSTKGPKGNDVMTTTNAYKSALTSAKRYLVGMIFNLSYTDKGDDDGYGGNGTNLMGSERVEALSKRIRESNNWKDLKAAYFDAAKEAKGMSDPTASAHFAKINMEAQIRLEKENHG